ncbi:hypothetical protein [Streptomyces sp. 1222.5]
MSEGSNGSGPQEEETPDGRKAQADSRKGADIGKQLLRSRLNGG